MDPVYKKEMAINLTRNYFELQKNFVRDSHNHDVCVRARLLSSCVFSVIQPVSCPTTGQQHDRPNVHRAFTGTLLSRIMMDTVQPYCHVPLHLTPSLSLLLPPSLHSSLHFSVPPSFPQNRMLVAEHSLLEKIIGTLLQLLEPCVDPTSQTYKLRSSNYKHSRLAYIMYDLRWVESLVM